MADSKIAGLFIDLELNTARFIEGLDRSRTLSTAFGTAAGQIFANVAQSVVQMGIAAARAFPEMVNQSIDFADSLRDVSQRTGITTENLSSLNFVARQSGADISDLNTTLARFSRNIFEASDGTGAQADAFHALGISVKDSSGNLRDTNDILDETISALAGIDNPAKQAAISTELFGKSGINLIPVINDLKGGLSEARDRAGEFGQVIGSSTAAAADQFNTNLTLLASSLSGLANTVAAEILPSMIEFTESMVNFAKNSETLPIIARLIGDAFRGVVIVVQGMIGNLEAFGTLLGGIGRAASNIASGEFSKAWDTMGKSIDDARLILDDTAVAQQKVADKVTASIQPTRRATTAIDGMSGKTTELTKEQKKLADELQKTKEEFQDQLRPADQLNDKFVTLATSGARLSEITAVMGEKAVQAAAQQRAQGQAVSGLTVVIEALGRQQQQATERLDEWRAAEISARSANLQYASSVDLVGDAQVRQMGNLDALIASNENYLDVTHTVALANQAAAGDIEGITKASETLGGVLQNQVSTAITDMSRGIADSIVHWKGFGETALSVVQSLATGIIQILIEGALKRLAEKVLDVIGNMGHLGSLFGAGESAAAGAASGAAGAAGGAAGSAGNVAGSISGGITSLVGAIGSVAGAISGIISNFQNARQEGTLNAIEGNTRKIYEATAGNWGEDAMARQIKRIAELSQQSADNSWELHNLVPIRNAASRMADVAGFIADVNFPRIENLLVVGFTNVNNTLQAIVQWTRETAQNIAQPLNAMQPIPALAGGGIVSSPTVAMIGEGGPEAVVPLSKLSGTGTVIHASITVVASDPKIAGQSVLRALRRAAKQNRGGFRDGLKRDLGI